jgi:hypothetical protein
MMRQSRGNDDSRPSATQAAASSTRKERIMGDFAFVVMDTASADPKEPAVKKLKPDGLNELLQSQFQTARRLLTPGQ